MENQNTNQLFQVTTHPEQDQIFGKSASVGIVSMYESSQIALIEPMVSVNMK